MPLNKKRRGSNDYRDDEQACKRLKKLPSYNPQEICQDLYDIVRNQKTEDGRLLCEPFIRAPKRRNEPDYYVTVNTPMDLLKIQHRLKSEEYDDVEEMASDFELMINNAKSFYPSESMEHRQALELWDLFQQSKTQLVSQALGDYVSDKREAVESDEEASTSEVKKSHPATPKVPVLKLKVMPNSAESVISMDSRSEQPVIVDESSSCFSNVVSSADEEGEEETKTVRASAPKKKRRTKKAMLEAMMSGEDPASSTTNNDDDELLIEQLFSATVTASDDNRCLSDMFRVLPSKTRFPEYYQVIKDPIDLRLIARRIQSSSYPNVDVLLKDILLLVSNAKTFNEPGSQIYKDATTLKKMVMNKKQELEQVRQVRSQRTRGRSMAQQHNNLSTVFAALKSESDEETMGVDAHQRGSDGEMSDEDSSVSDQWSLYNEVKDYRDSSDQVLCEPFLRLPSKRFYPDYYLEIKRPMSIMKIQKKIKAASYQDLEEVASDFNLVFNNAKQYNREDSRIYQDADTLQKAMHTKYMELTRNNKDGAHEIFEQRKLEADVEEVKRKSTNETLQKTLHSLFKTLFDFKVGERHVIDLFITLPSRKDYPDYYKVISQPIDMNTIDQKIRTNKYANVQSLVGDFELMFRNARHYNEETSQVYKDAEMLERLMHNRVQQTLQVEQGGRCLSPVGGSGSPSGSADKTGPKSPSTKLQELINKVKDYTDSKGRVLSTPFMKLPHKNDYPDYYEVITRPMDLLKIQQKLQTATANNPYNIDDMFADLNLVFNNARIYNEPDSQIYKDAVTLLKVCSDGRSELNEESMRQVLHVPSVVQRILNTLIQLTISYSDKEGRCFADTFCELSASDSISRPYLTFDEIVLRVEQGAYKRLDCLQDDVFKLCEHARNQSTINSQLYEDAVEVQDFFIRKRNDLCGEGDVLHSPALHFTLDRLYDNIVREKRDKMAVDSLMGSNEEEDEKEDVISEEPCMTFEHKGQFYTRGDFVYIRPRESGCAPPIMSIEKILTQGDGQTVLKGHLFLRPMETVHVPMRKFIEKEVFKSEVCESVTFDKVVGRCYVIHVQQIVDHQPRDIPSDDLYLCESKYSTKKKSFRKIKKWTIPLSPKVKLVKRSQPILPPRRSPQQPSAKVSMATNAVVMKHRVPVAMDNLLKGEPGATYYEQMKGPNCWIRIGDCVAVKNTTSSDRQILIRVDRLWTTSSGETMMSGMSFLHPSDVESTGATGSATRLYYRKELLLSNREEVRSCSDVTHLCSVLSSRDYCLSRYTEVVESDVYVCDYKFNENEKAFKKFNKPLKHPCLSSSVCEDEILYFKKPIIIVKEPISNPQSGIKVSDVRMIEEESMDFCSSVGDQSINESTSFIGDASIIGVGGGGAGSDLTPNNIKKRKKRTTKVRNITGYIVYAGECRKDIQAEFPELNFGDISRAVGTRWKNLPREQKEKYEEKAKILLADINLKANESQFSSAVPSPGADSRSMSPNSLIVTAVPIRSTTMPATVMEAVIQPSINQLPQQYMPTSFIQAPPTISHQPIACGAPIFVGVPPQTQKIVHSEVYLRYIHSLARGNKRIGNFDMAFSAKGPESVSMETSKLPSHWLGGGPGHHGDVLSALWAMREHMLRDALNIHNIIC